MTGSRWVGGRRLLLLGTVVGQSRADPINPTDGIDVCVVVEGADMNARGGQVQSTTQDIMTCGARVQRDEALQGRCCLDDRNRRAPSESRAFPRSDAMRPPAIGAMRPGRSHIVAGKKCSNRGSIDLNVGSIDGPRVLNFSKGKQTNPAAWTDTSDRSSLRANATATVQEAGPPLTEQMRYGRPQN